MFHILIPAIFGIFTKVPGMWIGVFMTLLFDMLVGFPAWAKVFLVVIGAFVGLIIQLYAEDYERMRND